MILNLIIIPTLVFQGKLIRFKGIILLKDLRRSYEDQVALDLCQN